MYGKEAESITRSWALDVIERGRDLLPARDGWHLGENRSKSASAPPPSTPNRFAPLGSSRSPLPPPGAQAGRRVLSDRPGNRHGGRWPDMRNAGRSVGQEHARRDAARGGACAVGCGAGRSMRSAARRLEELQVESEVIATTPPLTCNMEEQVSQTSSPESGTHLSTVSGFSLGEAIVQRAKQEHESELQLQAAAETGGLTSVSVPRLLLTAAEHQPSLEEFPTMEEGPITVNEESTSTQGDFGKHQPRQVFELQASGLSPILPLLASYSTQNQEEENFSNMFFDRSPVEFAPLRGTPDLSGVSCVGHTRAFQVNNLRQAVTLEMSSDRARGSLSLSQHPLGDTSSACSLSQYSLTPPSPKWSEGTEDEDFAQAEKYIRDQCFMELPSVLPCTKSDGSQPRSGGVHTVSGHELTLVGELPTPPLLEEEEVGLLNSSGLTSSSRSETETSRPLGDHQRSSSLGAGDTHGKTGKEWEPSACDPQPAPEPRWTLLSQQSSDPELFVLHKQSDLTDPRISFPKPPGNGNTSSADPGRPEISDAVVQSQERQASISSQISQLECPRPSSSDSPATSINGLTSGTGLVTVSIEPAISNCGKGDKIVAVLSPGCGDSKDDGTELGQKDSELSPAECPPSFANSSLLTSLADPVCQSTPALPSNLPARAPAQSSQGKRVANRLIERQAPATGTSKFLLAPSFGKPTLSSASEEAASCTSWASPATLQSMPPLSYVEKVGAWDLHRCPGNKPSFDSLVLHGLRGVSPRQRAYSAIADSLNHILSRVNGGQISNSLPRRSIAANFGTAPRQSEQQQPVQSDGQPSGSADTAVPRGDSQPGARGRSFDEDSLHKSDPPRSCLNEERGSGVRSLESVSALGKCPSSCHSGAGPLRQEDPPVTKLADRRINIDSAQIPRGPEHRAISPGPCCSSTDVHPDQFDVASPEDEANLPGSSQDTSQVGEQTLTVSGHSLTSLEVDNYIPIWTPSRLTPDPNQFNMEDRIPIYLQNLGINQSPGSILGSKGPLKQLDLTPVELKRLRHVVTETRKGFQDADGLSLLDHVSRYSFNSDTLTHSTSIAIGSDRGQDTPNRTDMSPGLLTNPAGSRSSSVYPPVTRQLDFSQHPALTQPVLGDLPEGKGKPSPSLLNTTSSLSSSSVCRSAGWSSHSLESHPDAVTRDPKPFWSSQGSKRASAASPEAGVQTVRERVETFSAGRRSWRLSHPHQDDTPRHEDEFIGLKTLSEIRKLLSETGTPQNKQVSLASDFPPEKLDFDNDEVATLANGGEGEFLSRWAVTSPQSNRLLEQGPGTGVCKGRRTPPMVGNASRIARSLAGEGEWQALLERRTMTAGGDRATRPAFAARVGRVEPEGCSGATVGRLGTVQPAECSGSCSKPIRLTASTPQAPPPVPQLTGHMLSDGSRTGAGLEEDSSTDSLAARVSNLLRDQSPTTQDRYPSRAAGRVNHTTYGKEQMKLLKQSPDPLSTLAEEDRRKIEEIKAELLQASKNLTRPQDGYPVDAEDLSLTPDLASSIDASPETELPALPPAAFQSVSTARSQISSQLQKLSDNQFDTTVQLRTPLRRNLDKQLKAMDRGSPVSDYTQSPPSPPAKPIIAITFSSRKKPPSSSPQPSTPLPKKMPSRQQGATGRPDEESPGCVRAVRDEVAQLLSPMFGKIQEEGSQSDPKQREQLTTENSIQGQTVADTGESLWTDIPTEQKPRSSSPDPCSPSPTRTVLSHIRVTLSPNRPAACGALPHNIPTTSGKVSAEDTRVTGEGAQPAPPPALHDSPGVSCPLACQPAGKGPPYPPLPMPTPGFYPGFLPLFDYPSEAKPEPRVPIAQDGGKVDVSTQTIIRPSSDPPGPAAVTVGQEVSTQTRGTQPDVALKTTVSTTATSSHTLVTQGTDVPVLLPYKPAGSTKLFYMPNEGIRSRIGQLESESSSESLREDSQEAPLTRTLTEIQRARGDIPSSKLTKHRERAKHNKAAAPKKAREKEEARLLKTCIRCHQSSLAPGAGTLPTRMPLQHVGDGTLSVNTPVQYDSRTLFEAWNRHPEARQQASEREPSGRESQPHTATRQTRPADRDTVWPLTTGEAPRPWDEGGHPGPSYLERTKAAARKARHRNSRGHPPPTRFTELTNSASPPAERSSGPPGAGGTERYSSLDELWQRFKERQKKHKRLGSSSASELSLLERLDALARILRNPVQHSLFPAEGRDRQRRKAQRDRRLRVWEDTAMVGPSPPSPDSLATPRSESADSLEEISTDRIKKLLQHQRYVDMKGDSSAGPPTTESETTTPAETDAQTQTETGSSISTIDTARLVRAFGPERVNVQPLSRLYGSIEKQKGSSVYRRRPRRAETMSQNAASHQVSRTRGFTVPESTSTLSPSAHPPRGPSSKLINKKCTRLVNQGVQTESLEIVTSAKGRRTRDAGVTFPSPDSNSTLARSAALGTQRQHSASPTGRSFSAKDRKKKGSSHTERGHGQGGRTLAGPAWFIPAGELKWASRKENVPGPCHSSTSGNFTLLPSTAVCREPLQEKQLQQQWTSDPARCRDTELSQIAAALRNPSPLIRITLKEALHMNRPDFISHSRQRVRRLELLMEERKIQSILQSERERLFNQSQETDPRNRQGCQHAEAILLKRKIPKREMFDRSKRLYDQLPEVIRKREEDRRKAEYQTNRLKAQLYRQKITNHVLEDHQPCVR
ncbi:ALMS1 centrosome and basal body associated protein [Mustelus asterias]